MYFQTEGAVLMAALEITLVVAALLAGLDRDLVAVRLLDDRDDRPGRPPRRPRDDDLGLRHVHARRAGRRRADLRRCSRSPAALLQGADHGAAYIAAAAIAAGRRGRSSCAASPILPQLRRQLPEHWRRVMPMPVAAGLYGVLLGLGFTTFVLTFGVFALAGIVFARRRAGGRASPSGSRSGSGGRCRSR